MPDDREYPLEESPMPAYAGRTPYPKWTDCCACARCNRYGAYGKVAGEERSLIVQWLMSNPDLPNVYGNAGELVAARYAAEIARGAHRG